MDLKGAVGFTAKLSFCDVSRLVSTMVDSFVHNKLIPLRAQMGKNETLLCNLHPDQTISARKIVCILNGKELNSLYFASL